MENSNIRRQAVRWMYEICADKFLRARGICEKFIKLGWGVRKVGRKGVYLVWGIEGADREVSGGVQILLEESRIRIVEEISD